MATAKDAPRVFISYSHRDDGRIRDVVAALAKSGISTWSDESIRPGDSWKETIETALRDCSVQILCISPAFLSSNWTMLEMGFALSRVKEPGFSLIPLLLDHVTMPVALRHFQAIDGRTLTPAQIADEIVRSVGQSPEPDLKKQLKMLSVSSQRYLRQHNWEMAKGSLSDAIIVCQQIGDRKTQASLCCNLGLVYERLGDVARATSLHQQALEIDTQLGYEEGIANHLFNLGRLAALTDRQIARRYLTQAEQLYSRLGLQEQAQDVEQWLRRITKP